MSDKFDFSDVQDDVRPISAMMTEVPADYDFGELQVNDDSMPVLVIRNNVPFPFLTFPVYVDDEKDLKMLRKAHADKECVIIVASKGESVDNPGYEDLYHTGVFGSVANIIKMPDGTDVAMLVLANRAKLLGLQSEFPYLRGKVELDTDKVPNKGKNTRLKALLSNVADSFDNLMNIVGDQETQPLRFAYSNFTNEIKGMHFICANLPLNVEEKMSLLEADDIMERGTRLLTYLDQVTQMMEIKSELAERTRMDLTQQQRENFLRHQLHTIQDELGAAAEDTEFDELRAKAREKFWSDAAAAHFEKELKKLERYNPSMPEYSIQFSYLETLLNLPWDVYSDDEFSIAKVQEILDRDHYGLEKVKERIVEHMAVLKLRGDMKSPILCLYGPPGVGKTSLGKSIADAMGREYARVSLGGLHDEAEIRGHRKTYVGAMPGRIIAALAKCGKGNPVFVLDEIDKLGKDFKGDPSQALLEVLDPEQNSKFHDNYVDFDYDLSKVLFLATANSISDISKPLLDRMELIEISGYIAEEKVEIALRHLLPKELVEHGFAADEISFERESMELIVDKYTRESGVRQLDKKIAKVLRKIARMKASDEDYPRVVTPALVKEFLGREEVTPELYENNDFAGVVTGLAWTSVGGEILFIESSLSKGKGEKLTLTGNLGDVMKESATIALQYLRSHASQFGIPDDVISTHDIHIHVPEGAIPKDGPSAGITMATSLASAFTGRRVRDKLAMTGEITLRGKVLPVGGIKEKILAAKRAGITDIILCSQNRKDIEEIEDRYLEGLTFHYFDRVEEVLSFALLEEQAKYR